MKTLHHCVPFPCYLVTRQSVSDAWMLGYLIDALYLLSEDLWPPSVVEASWNYPQTDAERARYLVFKDLWQQQYFLSGAAKFGGDFLVYPGKQSYVSRSRILW